MATRKPANFSPEFEPDDTSDSLLVSLDELIAVARAQKATPTVRAERTMHLMAWSDATLAAAAALPVAVELPTHSPAKGPGATLEPPGFVAAPKDLGALDHTVCPERRNDPLLAAIRAALLNDWHGRALHRGESAASGGVMPLPVLLTVLATRPEQQKARKWAQRLVGSGQTNLLAQVANVAGRFALLRPQGITLVRDFYAAAD